MQPVRGMKDWIGKDAWKREFVISKIKKVFQMYGYEPMETPAVEYYETLAAKGGGGQEIRDEIYYFKDKSGRELGLRFDLTVPTARVVASRPDMPKPYKRYAIGKVWRYDRPQAGRYREFTQADIDVFGCPGILADLETVDVAVSVMKELGFKEFKIRVNNRKVLEAMMLISGIPGDKVIDAFRAIDKLDKIGWEGVEEELEKRGIENYQALIETMKENNFEKAKPGLETMPLGKLGVEELELLLGYAEAIGISEYLQIDLSLVRGLEYYTGNVFEIKAGGQWSCGGGGRYDSLVDVYGGPSTPAVGISFGIERVIQLMDEFGLFKDIRPNLVYIAPVGEGVLVEAWRIAKKLREMGIPAECDLMGRKLKKQFEYANATGIRYMLIIGERDLEDGLVTFRDMEKREEKKIRLDELGTISSFLVHP